MERGILLAVAGVAVIAGGIAGCATASQLGSADADGPQHICSAYWDGDLGNELPDYIAGPMGEISVPLFTEDWEALGPYCDTWVHYSEIYWEA